MTKGLVLDMIGSVQIDNLQKNQMFNSEIMIKNEQLDVLSPQEKKQKLLEFLVQQRRFDIENRDEQDISRDVSGANSAMNGMRLQAGNALQIQKRYQAGGVNFPPYGLHPSASLDLTRFSQNKDDITPLSVHKSESTMSFLPPVKKSYYMAHSIDLSQPDFTKLKVNHQKQQDDVYYENQKDNLKVQNRSISPEQLKNSKVYESANIQSVKRRNIESSEDLPFNQPYYSKDKDFGGTMQISMERRDKSHTFKLPRRLPDIEEESQKSLFPIIKSTSQAYLDIDVLSKLPHDVQTYKRDQMQQILQPLKKDASFTNNKTYGKLEQEIQKQVQISKAQGFNSAQSNQKVQMNRFRNKNKEKQSLRYATLDNIREDRQL
ncbi:UNKNOWN [Stylonychia lemnae]|uniref:Uncharacterized protein n=1 Tax=Stylonychia lemnae TaxID=5949 RepID=A0A078ACF6_STYLE|nr:UNKNOWN [Stylonychia lemnae]|eukprot:CDW79541.1 UNKNOWN [Stylonychia lemnae]